MADDNNKKNGRHFHLGTALIILGIIGGPLAVWGDQQRTDGVRDEKISQMEKRQSEDRRATRESVNEVKEHVKAIDQATQIILQEVRAMKAVQESERRRR